MKRKGTNFQGDFVSEPVRGTNMMAVIGLTLGMALMAGCGGGREKGSDSAVISAESEAEKAGNDENGADADVLAETTQTGQEDKADGNADTGHETKDDEVQSGKTMNQGNGEGENTYSINDEGIFIGGKVRSVSQDSFVISRTLVDDDGYIIKMPEAGSPEEELVTIRFADAVTFERWTISGGDVEREEASFAEVQEGSGLEAQGYFDGEEFVARKVIIEIYE